MSVSVDEADAALALAAVLASRAPPAVASVSCARPASFVKRGSTARDGTCRYPNRSGGGSSALAPTTILGAANWLWSSSSWLTAPTAKTPAPNTDSPLVPNTNLQSSIVTSRPPAR